MRIVTADNNCGDFIVDDPRAVQDLRNIADCRIDSLVDKNKNDVWLFPSREDNSDDKIDDELILSLTDDGRLTTGNIMGFIGCGDTELTIRSRFSKSADNDWFMQYMLQKVFSINIFDLRHKLGEDSALDIAALLFPYFLQKAVLQGIYREYIRCAHNDSRVRGALDISAHIRENYPFRNGRIAYTTREYNYDNSVTELIRHTIEYLRSKSASKGILYSTQETQDYIKQMVQATPSYNRGDLRKVMLANSRPKIHPYYSEYRPLQKLCLQILRHEKLGYGESSSDRIHGVLFDGAWLWEEYLNLTLTKAGFTHPKNKTGEGAIFPFLDRPNRYKRFPDFIKDSVIADAKYKRLSDPKDSRRFNDNIRREDLSQMISYLHITSSKTGIFICPSELLVMNPDNGEYYPDTKFILRQDELFVYKVGDLSGDGGRILIIGLNIPRSPATYRDFAAAMSLTETGLLKALQGKF